MTRAPKHVEALFDLHVHSQYSPDGRGTLSELAAVAKKNGLQGFAVTDHNVYASRRLLKEAAAEGILIVPGMEVSTRVGHCLAIGIRKAVTPGLSLAETLDEIKDAGGVGIPSHPYRLIHGVGEGELDQSVKKLTAIEVYNARDGNSNSLNPRSDAYATTHSLGGTGGSDTHQVFEIGNAYTMFPQFPNTVDDLVRQLQRRKTWGGGKPTPSSAILAQKVRTFGLWVRRGFKPL